ncbi:MAG: hypothetical protein NVS2B12_01730 [Ktedonobacteraceae bacterium]
MDDQKHIPLFRTYPRSTTDEDMRIQSNIRPATRYWDKNKTAKKLQHVPHVQHLGIVSNTPPDEGRLTQPYNAFINSGSPSQKPSSPPRTPRALMSAVVLLMILLFGALGYTFWYVFLATQPVTVYQVGKKQDVSQYIGGGGLAYAHQQLDMSFPVAERVIDVLVKAGDHVKLNQPLIKLDPTQLNAQVTQASNDVAAAQSYLNTVSNNSPYNPTTVAQAQQAFEIAKNHYNALVAQASTPTLNSGNLIAPVNGVVTTVNINPGEVFGANSILLTIMDLSTVTVRAKIALVNLQEVKTGLPAQVTPSALPDLTLKGTITSIIPQADPQTDTFEVWVNVPNAQQVLLPGMSAFVRIQGQQAAFVVPRMSVLNPDRESSVFLVNHGHVYMHPVHVAGNAPDVFLIDNGLSANDTIIVLPLNKLHEGQAVNITNVEH